MATRFDRSKAIPLTSLAVAVVGALALSLTLAQGAKALQPASDCLNGWQFFDDGQAYPCGSGGSGKPAKLPKSEKKKKQPRLWPDRRLKPDQPGVKPRSEFSFREYSPELGTDFELEVSRFKLGELRLLDRWWKDAISLSDEGTRHFTGCAIDEAESDSNFVVARCRRTELPQPPSCEDSERYVNPGVVGLEFAASCFDPAGLRLVIRTLSAPTHASMSPDETWVGYATDTDFYGTDHFTFRVSNGRSSQNSNPAAVTVHVNARPECAQRVDAWVSRGLEKKFTFTCDDPYLPEGFRADVERRPAHGELSVVGAQLSYTADPDYLGPDSFTVRGVDGLGLEAANSSTYELVIREAPPVCKPATAYGVGQEAEDVVKFKVSCGLPDGLKLLSPISYWVGSGEHGTATVDPLTGQVVYHPDETSTGIDHVPYEAINGGVRSNPSVVTVRTVRPDR